MLLLPVVVFPSSSDDSAISYVLPIFVDDAMFSHNGDNGPESRTTRMFSRVRRMAASGQSFCLLYR